MAATKITLSLDPQEYRIVQRALDVHAWALQEEAEATKDAADRRDLRERRIAVLAIIEKV